MTKTPYILSILLDVYSGRPIRENKTSPIYQETIEHLLADMWIQVPEISNGAEYMPTMKLRAFMKHVMNLPDPVQSWTMP
jgi:hypothetical protein